MVEEETSIRALTGRRRLHKSFQPLQVDYNPDPSAWGAPGPGSKQWKKVAGLFSAWFIEDYFDTSGYTNDSLTSMPLGAFVQEAGRLSITYPGTSRMIVLDMVLERRVDDLPALCNSFISNSGLIPSFPNSTDDWSQVLFGRYRELTGITQGTATSDIFSSVMDNQFGSLDATTNDKLWIYKIIILLGIPPVSPPNFSTLRFPNSRMVLDVDVVKESDLEFIMRQKRSYELTNY